MIIVVVFHVLNRQIYFVVVCWCFIYLRLHEIHFVISSVYFKFILYFFFPSAFSFVQRFHENVNSTVFLPRIRFTFFLYTHCLSLYFGHKKNRHFFFVLWGCTKTFPSFVCKYIREWKRFYVCFCLCVQTAPFYLMLSLAMVNSKKNKSHTIFYHSHIFTTYIGQFFLLSFCVETLFSHFRWKISSKFSFTFEVFRFRVTFPDYRYSRCTKQT